MVKFGGRNFKCIEDMLGKGFLIVVSTDQTVKL